MPLVALAALTVDGIGRHRDLSPELAALIATALSWCVLLAVQVGVFASRFVEHLAERDLLTAVPVLFVVFSAWLARGCPRPQPFTALAVAIVAVPAIALPVHQVATREAALDSFSTIPLRRLAETTSEGTLDAVWAVGAGLVVILAVLMPSRLRVVLLAVVAVALVGATIGASVEVRRMSVADDQWWFGDASPRWIDEATEQPVTFVQADTPNWSGLWKQAFWNERIASVAVLPGTAVAGPIPTRLVSPRFDGVLFDESGRALEQSLLAAPREMTLVGEQLAGYGPAGDLAGLGLWRVEGPPRLSTWSEGVQSNGDLLGTARITVFDCSDGRLELTLLGKQGLPVRFSIDGKPAGQVTTAPGGVWNGFIPAPADAAEKCEFALDSPGLTGSTRIEYVRPRRTTARAGA